MKMAGWRAFALWAVPGVALGFLVSAIGLFLLPVGMAATVLLARRTRPWPELLGIFEGIAGVCLLIVALHARDYWGCPPSGKLVTRTATTEIVESCGAFNPWPWLVIGIVCAVGGAVTYALAKRHTPTEVAPTWLLQGDS